MVTKIHEFLTNPKYKDRWIMVHLPNAVKYGEKGKKAFYGKFLKGFLHNDRYDNSYSMNTGDDNVDMVTDLVREKGKRLGEGLSTATSRVFSEILTYSGSNNSGTNFTFTVVPEESGNMTVIELEEFISKLINPEPYNYSFKIAGGNTYKTYVEEFRTTNQIMSSVKSARDNIKGYFTSEGVKESKSLSDGLTHIHIGDNIHLTGMVITDTNTSATMLRDEDGQFYGYEINLTIAPYRLLDAEQSYKMITQTNAWEIQ